MLKGYQSQGAKVQQPTQLSTVALSAAVDAGQQLSSKLQEFKNFRDKQASVQAQADASAQAYKDSVEGKPFNQRVNNTYGAVYNQVRTATYSAKAELQLAERSAKAAQEFENDPEGYDNSFNSFVASLSESAPTPELKATIKITGDKRRTATYGALKQEEAKRIKADAVQTFARSWDLNINQIIELNKSDKTRADFEKGKNLVYLNTMVKDGMIDSSTAQKLTIDANYKIEYGTAINKMEDLLSKDNLDEARQFLINETQTAKESMDVTQNKKYNDDLKKLYNNKIKADKAATAGLKEEANLVLTKVNKIKALGKTPPIDLENRAKSLFQYASLAKQDEATTQDKAYDVIKKFDYLSLPEQEMKLAEFKSSTEMTNVDVKVLGAIEKNLSDRKAKAVKDPQTLSIEEGINKPTPPIGVSNGLQALAEILPQRAINQTKNKLEYGEGATQLFTDAEASEWGNKLESVNTSIEEKLSFIDAVNQATPNNVNAVFNQLRKKGASTFSYAASMALEGKRDVARGILQGQQTLKEIGNQEYIKEFKTTLLSDIGNSMFYSGSGDRQSLLDSALAYSVYLAEQNGDVTDLRRRGEKKAIKDLTNGIHSRNKQDFFLPSGVDDDGFDEWIDEKLNVSSFNDVANITPEQALEFTRGKGKIVSVGSGKYAIFGSNRTALKNKDGSTLILEY